MIIERVLNNNSLITLDKFGYEVVLVGKGIGFKKKRGDKVDLKDVNGCFREESAFLTSDIS